MQKIMLKYFGYYLISTLLSFLLFGLIGVFIAGSYNVMGWHWSGRLLLVFMSFIHTPIIIVKYMIETD